MYFGIPSRIRKQKTKLMDTQQTTFDKIRTRPRFKMLTHLSAEEYEQNLKHYLAENTREFSGNINREAATIWVKSDHSDYWKPTLALRTVAEDGNILVRGIFGPTSAVWTFFMFLYFLWIISWMIFFTLWFVERQIHSNEFPWALPASFATLGLLAATYIAAKIGQRKAKKEMEMLRRFAMESTLPFEKEISENQLPG